MLKRIINMMFELDGEAMEGFIMAAIFGLIGWIIFAVSRNSLGGEIFSAIFIIPGMIGKLAFSIILAPEVVTVIRSLKKARHSYK